MWHTQLCNVNSLISMSVSCCKCLIILANTQWCVTTMFEQNMTNIVRSEIRQKKPPTLKIMKKYLQLVTPEEACIRWHALDVSNAPLPPYTWWLNNLPTFNGCYISDGDIWCMIYYIILWQHIPFVIVYVFRFMCFGSVDLWHGPLSCCPWT